MKISSSSSKPCSACKNGVEPPFPFSMAFQPILDTEARKVYAYEALVRGPEDESAYTVLSQLTTENRYTFDQACRVKAVTLAKALDLDKTRAKLCINFMPGAVYSPAACIQLTLDTARQVKFPLDRLIFEITESEEVQDREHLRGIFQEYRKHGFKMALDDFGAGFSGINLFVGLTPDIVKLDTELTRNIHQRAVALAVMASLVLLCDKLGVLLIAEGVESKEEFYALRGCGVRFMQGFLFARPAFEKLPSFTLPYRDFEIGVGDASPIDIPSPQPAVFEQSTQQVPVSFAVPGQLDMASLNRLTELAANSLGCDGAFLLLNSDGRLTLACRFGELGSADIETLQFVVDAGPARGNGAIITHSLADRRLLATTALQQEGRFLGVFGICKQSAASVSSAQECILQRIALDVTEDLERARLMELRISPPPSDIQDPLAQELMLLKSVVVNANDSVLITDAEPIGLPDPIICYANPAFTRLTGYSAEEVLGKTPRLLQGPQTDPESVAKINKALKTWSSIEIELLNYKKDGTPFWVELSISPVANSKGWFTHWVSVQRDITRRKEKEERESARVQSALMNTEAFAAKGRLAATIAHEINNPLEAVTALIYLAKTTEGITEDLAGLLNLADQEIARVSRIAQQTLGFYRDASRIARIDVVTLMRSTAAVYASLLHSKQIILEEQISPDLTIVAKEEDLKQIFSNLLVNALDATPKGGRIILRAHAVSAIGYRRQGVRVIIADNGGGMSPEVQSRAFSAFFTTKAELGTGIGLWVTKNLLVKAGGSIRCRSRQGERCGTIMSVFLPSDSATSRNTLEEIMIDPNERPVLVGERRLPSPSL